MWSGTVAWSWHVWPWAGPGSCWTSTRWWCTPLTVWSSHPYSLQRKKTHIMLLPNSYQNLLLLTYQFSNMYWQWCKKKQNKTQKKCMWNSNDKPAYLQEIPHIWGCARPNCQQAEHRPFWLVYMMHPLQTWEATVSETMFRKEVLNTDKKNKTQRTTHQKLTFWRSCSNQS